MRILISSLPAFILSISFCIAQGGFRVVPLGVKGGGEDGNLSAYMVAPVKSNAFVCLDAGTVTNGIAKAVANKVFPVPADVVLRQYIKAYLISHPHLDHLSGMVINSVEDTAKNIYGTEYCIETLKKHYFNWQSWPNLANEGASPALKKYSYKMLGEDQEVNVEQTEMVVKIFRLSHSSPYESTAFLIRKGESYVLYFGDTGPDEVEKSDKMATVWKAIAPLVKAKQLAGIFLEVSYPNNQQDRQLYGHLTPKWFMKELNVLAENAGAESLRGLNVVVTHMKSGGDNVQKIKAELAAENTLRLNLIFPEQGKAFELK
ncbi:3',5'-cyclic-nucleotide phosphodiesterase [Dyadobacter chenwenxiniae]|uniref:3',5'-cyclic-nucleotide phosphodiesterase n=1 Tax=Dyadobacter chenwenxiniae TaxID=2906456 RepID=A0A9X1PNM3_9BACT|nr:3',5'-cyclic-nucleotide phosphodiesterase [Dyadobacter chenwenxiniae]MCF0064238.1 3',5'-cyclic-nucleotide phosphodiesterase [Dyadobacter chenwenxiniae]UON82548.1 3',5'-cyclic-nucleotide phosphodiesterase [Dyadobacter chenwenxiniae]